MTVVQGWRSSRVYAARLGHIGLVCLLMLGACSHSDTPPLQIEIDHTLAGQPLQLGEEYALADGEQIRIDRLRYYLSNFRLRRADGSWSAAERSERDARGYYLVDAALPASRRFEVAGFAAGEYQGVEFLIGVDAARNAAGVQSGALDPVHGMFWTWNTGYVFLKLEGHSPQSAESGQAVRYHVGGSRPPNDNARTVYLPLGAKPLRLQAELKSTVHLQAELAPLFAPPGGLRIAEHASLMDPAGGKLVADPFAGTFRVDHVHHEPRH